MYPFLKNLPEVFDEFFYDKTRAGGGIKVRWVRMNL